MKLKSPEERAEAIRAMIELARSIPAAMETLRQALEDSPTDMPEPNVEEQVILDLFDRDSAFTFAEIAKLLGDEEDNGTLRNRVSGMVQKKLLVNKRPRYMLPA